MSNIIQARKEDMTFTLERSDKRFYKITPGNKFIDTILNHALSNLEQIYLTVDEKDCGEGEVDELWKTLDFRCLR